LRELSLIKETSTLGVSYSRRGANDTSWDVWCTFCQDLHVDPFLTQLDDPILLLQIFAHRYREGTVAPSGAAVRSRTVKGTLCAVGQAFSSLGCMDPRLQSSDKLDFHLQRQLTAYKKQDPPPSRVKPIPSPLIVQTAQLNYMANTPHAKAVADMLLPGFFFLLRPGEYAHTTKPEASPFCMCDTHLLIHDRCLNHYTCTHTDIQRLHCLGVHFTEKRRSG